MKHRKSGRQFGRNRAQRKALMRTLLGSIVRHERIVTTEAKAKEAQRFMDRAFTLVRRAAKDTHPAMSATRKLEGSMPVAAIKKMVSGDFQERFSDRTSGFTRVVKMSPRSSDGARMAMIEFVDVAKDATAVEDTTDDAAQTETQETKEQAPA